LVVLQPAAAIAASTSTRLVRMKLTVAPDQSSSVGPHQPGR
jgi:hypothetical protein